jgi:hypothetical protein
MHDLIMEGLGLVLGFLLDYFRTFPDKSGASKQIIMIR